MSFEILLPPCALPRENLAIGPLAVDLCTICRVPWRVQQLTWPSLPGRTWSRPLDLANEVVKPMSRHWML
jgi:hypothetical protein